MTIMYNILLELCLLLLEPGVVLVELDDLLLLLLLLL